MCSIVEDDFGDNGGAHAMVEDEKVDETQICKKCKLLNSVAKSMCHQCFVGNIRHKFRATLGSTKIVRRHSNVLLDFTGNEANVCLAEMIRFAFEQESHKRLCFDLILVYVDENSVRKDGQEAQKRFEKIHEVKEVLAQFPNFKCYYTSVAGIDNEINLIDELSSAQSLAPVIEMEVNFLEKFTNLQSLSSKQDFLAVTRNDVLRHAAILLNCQYIFNSDTSVTLANRLLNNMSLGRGSSVAFDVAFCDDRIDSLKLVRPIKDLLEDDVKWYLKLENLNHLKDDHYGSNNGHFASIQNLTSKFIDDLQKNFSSTVSTVYRTCGKIASLDDAEEVFGRIETQYLSINDMNKRCVMCKSYLDYQNSETLFAINFSKAVSSGDTDNVNAMESIDDTKDAERAGNMSHMCHGCRNIFLGISEEQLKEIL